jgi:hypothetical protein
LQIEDFKFQIEKIDGRLEHRISNRESFPSCACLPCTLLGAGPAGPLPTGRQAVPTQGGASRSEREDQLEEITPNLSPITLWNRGR